MVGLLIQCPYIDVIFKITNNEVSLHSDLGSPVNSLNHHYKAISVSQGPFLGWALYLGVSYAQEIRVKHLQVKLIFH